MTDPRQFLLSTEYPVEQIVYLKSGSFISRSGQIAVSYRFNHGLGFMPLISGSWSLDANFSVSYDFYINPYKEPGNIEIVIITTDKEIIFYDSNNTGSDKTVYYRIYGFVPSNVDLQHSATASLTDNRFTFNTDYNYCKLAMAGQVSVSNNQVTVAHNLGFLPQVDVWAITNRGANKFIVGTGQIWVDEQNIYFAPNANQLIDHTTYQYRVYADGYV